MCEAEKNNDDNYDWLTESLFEPIIEKELNDFVRSDYELKLTSIKPAVGKGENYVSLVTRVELEVNFINIIDRKPKIFNFIVKSNIKTIKEIDDFDVFANEISFYEEIAANFRKIDPSLTCLPKYYAVKTEDRKIVIMNDLAPAGFKMQDRLVGLDLDHCKLYFKTIAQFHALGAVQYEKCGRYPDRFHQSLYRLEYKPMNDKWSEILYREFSKIFDRYENLKPYREKFHKWKEGIYEAICDITSEKLDEFNVINHGDSWVNNMLFRHDDDNKPIDLCFVDFQVSVYGTPMIDLLYFFVSSPNLDVRENHFDELLHIYHTSLVEHLKKYEYPKPIPTMRDLQMMVLKQGLLATFYLNGITSIVLLNSEDSRPLDFYVKEGDEGDTFRYNLFNTPRYVKALEVALKFLDRRGLLEV